MSAFLNQRLTNVGWDALSVALGGGRLTFFKMQAGKGTIANDAAIMGMTALVQPVCDIGITSYVIEGDGQITLFGNIASSTLDTGFNFKELGVFATIESPILGKGGTPSGPNIQIIPQTPGTLANPVVPNPPTGTALMYSYCNSYLATDYIPGKGESTSVVNTIQVTIKIDEAVVAINILQGQQMAVANIGAPSVGAGPWSFTQANIAWLKRLKPGASTIITEDANTITIGAKELTADLDLYVANGNPNISPNFSTINNAINYLGQYLIPTTIRARIHVQPGTYVMPGGDGSMHAYLNHPNSQNITIQGPQDASVIGTSIASITGSANNWSVTIGGVPDTSKFVVNNWVIVNWVGGATSNNHALICGFFKVTAKTASTVTYNVPYNKASFSMTGVNQVEMTPISVLLSIPINGNGFVTGSYGIGLLQYIGVVAQTTPTLGCNGVSIGGKGTLKFIGVAGFNALQTAQGTRQCNGIVSGYGSSADTNCISCGCSNNQNGIVSGGGGSAVLVRCAASHNKVFGFWFEGGGSCSFAQGWSFTGGNGSHGILVAGGSTCMLLNTIPFGFLFSHQNGGYGVCVLAKGLFQMGAGCYCNCVGNTSYDCVVDTFGLIYGQVNILGTRVFNAVVGQMGIYGGLIV